ncbi:type II CAAX prenyl endopeptidase Rce1 family protein [Mycetocola zhujimingii]|uniref:CAAX protease family protein n=1 Tax=Mycetocola zhujimingii TaxID=2079792 RepID=A0A2U1TI05_9MICO|nr:CPBP family glutamic-type intramembrane protease [Mycetocola zhujimingii]PWC08534.1 CAAX protease family protein [Mycetocola zhujimingii]
MTNTPTLAATEARPAVSWKLLPGILLALSGFLLFGLDERPAGYITLAVTLVAAVIVDRRLARDLVLIAVGLLALSLVPINTNIEWEHMLLMGAALAAAVLIPYLVSRFIYRDHAIKFPVLTGKRWTRIEFGYLIAVVILGWFLLPIYMIPTGVYENWPAASDPGSIARLFLGTNVLGIWDELFFICTTFTLLRRHFPDWQANLLQAVLFTSFLWELGFHAWGPFIIYPFAVLQGWIFRQTKSLSYIVSVHLLFDFILFLVLLHAHNRDWLAIFLY